MKMCVYAYDMRPEYKEVLQRDEPIPQQDTYDIGFSPDPKAWVIFGKHLADVELLILQRMNVRVGGTIAHWSLRRWTAAISLSCETSIRSHPSKTI